MLYPSLFFKTHRTLYYKILTEVRLRGNWERWLDFFAEGIEASATQAVATANVLLALVNADRDRIAGLGRAAPSALAVHQALQRQPIATSAAGQGHGADAGRGQEVRRLLPDAKPPEDHPQQILRPELPGDPVQLFLGEPQLLGEEIELAIALARVRVSVRQVLARPAPNHPR